MGNIFKKISIGLLASVFLMGAGCISFSGTTTSHLGAFRSGDKGESWTEINLYPTTTGVHSLATVKVYRIFTDPSDRNALYMATRGQGLFYSYNRGDSWQFVPAFNSTFIYGVAVDPTNKCTIFVT